MRRLLLAGILSLILVAPVQAGPEPFTYQQTGWRSSPPDVPCYEEDDGAIFEGYGRVAPGFRLDQTLTFCGGTDGPGGVGFWVLLVAHTDALRVQVTSPTGLSWPLTVERQGSERITQACVGDDHGTLDGVRSGTIEPGNWQISVIHTGTRPARDVRLTVKVGMQDDQPGDPAGCVF